MMIRFKNNLQIEQTSRLRSSSRRKARRYFSLRSMQRTHTSHVRLSATPQGCSRNPSLRSMQRTHTSHVRLSATPQGCSRNPSLRSM